MTIPAAISLATFGLALYLAVSNANAFAVRRGRPRRWFALLALSAACYAGPNAFLTLPVGAEAIRWASRISIAAAALHVLAWWHYAEADLAPVPRRLRVAIDALLLGLAALYFVPGVGLTGQILVHPSPLARAVFRVAEPTAWGGATFALLLCVLGFIAARYARGAAQGKPYAKAHLFSLLILLLAGAADAAVTLELSPLPYLLDLAFTFAVAAVGLVMSRRWSADVRALDAAVAARDEFISLASHELKSPLTSLLLGVQLIRQKLTGPQPPPPPEAALWVDKVERQVERLVRLVNQLLDVSRLEAARLQLELEEVELVSLARELLARLDVQGRVALLPSSPELKGRWDRLRLEQVLTNLVENALKYGAGKPVEVRIDSTASEAVVRVKDQGIGIPAAEQALLFRRFHRTAEARQFQGLGLGLYITRQIVEALGGAISVSSTPGQGSEFTVALPLSPPGR